MSRNAVSLDFETFLVFENVSLTPVCILTVRKHPRFKHGEEGQTGPRCQEVGDAQEDGKRQEHVGPNTDGASQDCTGDLCGLPHRCRPRRPDTTGHSGDRPAEVPPAEQEGARASDGQGQGRVSANSVSEPQPHRGSQVQTQRGRDGPSSQHLPTPTGQGAADTAWARSARRWPGTALLGGRTPGRGRCGARALAGLGGQSEISAGTGSERPHTTKPVEKVQ